MRTPIMLAGILLAALGCATAGESDVQPRLAPEAVAARDALVRFE